MKYIQNRMSFVKWQEHLKLETYKKKIHRFLLGAVVSPFHTEGSYLRKLHLLTFVIDSISSFMILFNFSKSKVITWLRFREGWVSVSLRYFHGCFLTSLTNNFDCDISLIFSHWILNYNSVYSLIFLFCPFNDEHTVVFMHLHTNSAFRFKQKLWAVKVTDKVIVNCVRAVWWAYR